MTTKVVPVDRRILLWLNGEEPHPETGRWFERPDGRGQYWWRSEIGKLLAAPSPVAQGEATTHEQLVYADKQALQVIDGQRIRIKELERDLSAAKARVAELEYALKTIGEYPKSRADEMSAEAMRVFARKAIAAPLGGQSKSPDEQLADYGKRDSVNLPDFDSLAVERGEANPVSAAKANAAPGAQAVCQFCGKPACDDIGTMPCGTYGGY